LLQQLRWLPSHQLCPVPPPFATHMTPIHVSVTLQVIGVSASVIGDMSSRPNWGLNELDFVFATLVVSLDAGWKGEGTVSHAQGRDE
jgi:hypothetical protein